MTQISVGNTNYTFTMTAEQTAALGEKAALFNSGEANTALHKSDTEYFQWVMGVWYQSETPSPNTSVVAQKITSTLNAYASVPTETPVQEEELSPEAAKARLLVYAANKRWEIETGGMVFGGMSIPTNDRAKLLLMGAADTMTNEQTAMFVVDGTAVQLTGAQFKAIYAEIVRRIQVLFGIQADIIGLINDGTYTTTAQIDAHDWSV